MLFVYPTTPWRDRESFIQIHANSTFASFLARGNQLTRVYCTRNDTTLPAYPNASLLGAGPHDRVFIIAFPDEPSKGFNILPSERRMAFALGRAHELSVEIGFEYDYLFYGDDDTFWNVQGVLEMLRGAPPPDVPFFWALVPEILHKTPELIDWRRPSVAWGAWMRRWPMGLSCAFGERRPSALVGEQARRAAELIELSACAQPWLVSRACRINETDVCAERHAACAQLQDALPKPFRPNCDKPPGARPVPATTYQFGGNGCIQSRALMTAALAGGYMACVLNPRELEKGDRFLTTCLQRTTGILPSLPFAVARQRVELFVPYNASITNTSRPLPVLAPPAESSYDYQRGCLSAFGRLLSCHVKAAKDLSITETLRRFYHVNISGHYGTRAS